MGMQLLWLIYRVSIKSFPDYKLIGCTIYRVSINSFPDYKLIGCTIYRVSINSFPDYKYLLQENYVEYKYIFFYQYLS